MDTTKIVRLRRRVEEEGLRSLPAWALRWMYWNAGLYRLHLHRLPILLREWRIAWLRFKQERVFLLRNQLLSNRPIRVKVGGVSFLMIPKGAEAAANWSGSRFERREIAFILQVLQSGMTFLDIGANVGIYAIAAAKKDPNVKVYAFEPCGWTFQVLEENIRLNALSNVAAIRTALGDRIGKVVLQVNAPGKDGLNTIGRPSHPDCQIIAQETVPMTTLDAFIQSHSVSRVDVMKVDVEGAELMVLRGGKNLLEREDAPLILYEGYSWCTKGFDYHPVEIMWLLQDYGYSLFVLDSESGKVVPRKSSHGYDAMIVAIKPEHPFFGKLQGNAR